jgi:hypothetical protein
MQTIPQQISTEQVSAVLDPKIKLPRGTLLKLRLVWSSCQAPRTLQVSAGPNDEERAYFSTLRLTNNQTLYESYGVTQVHL